MTEAPYEPKAPLKGADRPGHQVRRFWKTAHVEHHLKGFGVFLDGKALLSPVKNPTILPSVALAELIAHEWGSVQDLVEPGSMPFTRLGFSALDRLQGLEVETLVEAVGYYETDLLAYPSPYPRALFEAEEAHWAPIRAWMSAQLGVDFQISPVLGARPVSETDRQTVRGAMGEMSLFARAGFMMSLSYLSSWSLAYGLYKGFLSPDEAIVAASVGETFQAQQWGADPEAQAKSQKALTELRAIAKWYEAI